MRALRINKLEKPLTPPPSCHRVSEQLIPSIREFYVPRVSKVFLTQGLCPLGPPESGLDVIVSKSCSTPLGATVKCILVTEPGPCGGVSGTSWDDPGDSSCC